MKSSRSLLWIAKRSRCSRRRERSLLLGTSVRPPLEYAARDWTCSMLYEFIAINRDEIIRRCRAKVADGRSTATAEIDPRRAGLPGSTGGRAAPPPDLECRDRQSALQHGHDLLLQGFTVSQVVHDYGDVCQAITELAVEMDATISTEDFRMLNRCLDDAIAGAVTEYGREQNQSALDEETTRGNERVGFFAHELRNLINTAIVAFEVLKTGNVGVGGSTGAVLHRSLMGARDLIGRSLAEVRLTQGVAESGAHSSCPASSKNSCRPRHWRQTPAGISLTVLPVEEGWRSRRTGKCSRRW